MRKSRSRRSLPSLNFLPRRAALRERTSGPETDPPEHLWALSVSPGEKSSADKNKLGRSCDTGPTDRKGRGSCSVRKGRHFRAAFKFSVFACSKEYFEITACVRMSAKSRYWRVKGVSTKIEGVRYPFLAIKVRERSKALFKAYHRRAWNFYFY